MKGLFVVQQKSAKTKTHPKKPMTDILALLQPIQNSVSKEMLGRMMSLMMLSGTGLFPISQAISGFLSKWNLTLVFAIPGVLVLLMKVWTTFQPELKGFSAGLTNAEAER